ncbi:hypothetical protein [Campylobacter sp. JMF_03 NE3]|uniref:hypothetical protein n=1 Tax=Campylobacter sp. JMF_03 NE3 TaxID=2983831 RepID=UPI0022E9D529|nr:hypothetical protein [Campylobacter sp. JMF_03 NE3]MDA3053529.1 hypothetical protein [Campylobacter sp. JMF_03 NE3]
MRKETKELQNRIIKICDELNLDAVTLSKMIEFDNIELVDSVLNRKAIPSLSMLDKIISHLGINPVWLFDMPYPIGYTKFDISHRNMFKDKFFTSIYPKQYGKPLLHYCEETKIKHAMLVFEDFKETNNNPRVALIIEREYIYEVISVFDFFDIENSQTKEGLLDLDSIIDTTAFRAPINLLVQTFSIENFKKMLSNNHHIGNFAAKNLLKEKTANEVVDLVFEFRDELIKQKELSSSVDDKLFGKIDCVRKFLKPMQEIR